MREQHEQHRTARGTQARGQGVQPDGVAVDRRRHVPAVRVEPDSTTSPCRVPAGTRAVAVRAPLPGPAQRTVVRWARSPPDRTDGRERFRSPIASARPTCRSARCRRDTARAPPWVHRAAAVPAKGAPTGIRTATISAVHASTTSDRRRSGQRRRRRPRTRGFACRPGLLAVAGPGRPRTRPRDPVRTPLPGVCPPRVRAVRRLRR
ncbi:hypothetical protein ACIGAN_29010 [Streptomyces sp. NPDC085931]|uniref:hypothetical protein n=1 Tax=Streptomyces sp. NPDC085931 TaxID=3365740 RepID=UPI0037D5A41E